MWRDEFDALAQKRARETVIREVTDTLKTRLVGAEIIGVMYAGEGVWELLVGNGTAIRFKHNDVSQHGGPFLG